MTNQKEPPAYSPIKRMPDGNASMKQISLSLRAALEYRRSGTKIGDDVEIELGEGIIKSTMYLLALETALKGRYQKNNLRFEKTHDLADLYAGLPSEDQKTCEKNWKDSYFLMTSRNRGITLKEFLQKHRSNFINWRYLDKEELELIDIDMYLAITAINLPISEM